MTAVAALAERGRVVMVADTCTNYVATELVGAHKIERVQVGAGEALLAASGNGGLLNLAVQHWASDHAPDPNDERDVRRWAGVTASALTEIAAGATPPLLRSESDGSQSLDGAFLLGWHGRLFYLFTHMAVPVPEGIAALGLGADVCLGVMRAAREFNLGPDADILRLAVEIAANQHGGIRVGSTGPLVETLEAHP